MTQETHISLLCWNLQNKFTRLDYYNDVYIKIPLEKQYQYIHAGSNSQGSTSKAQTPNDISKVPTIKSQRIT